MVTSLVLTDTQEVFPEQRTVLASGEAIDSLTP